MVSDDKLQTIWNISMNANNINLQGFYDIESIIIITNYLQPLLIYFARTFVKKSY